MRTLLTYVLAALAASSAALAVLFLADPHRFGSVAGAAIGLIFYSVLALVVASPVWKILDLGRARFSRISGGMWRIPQGILVFLVPSAGFSMILSAINNLKSPAHEANFLDFLGPQIMALLVAGAAWGTVFWLRAPKPQTAGATA
ncbi:hypothetical protein [Maricaulis salignorans]|uniref:hypothetical protein n=1 Tax=Maricaulis salignorans TaxID=144026 RepID=UPI003A91A9D1